MLFECKEDITFYLSSFKFETSFTKRIVLNKIYFVIDNLKLKYSFVS